jgi:hypothetical protein
MGRGGVVKRILVTNIPVLSFMSGYIDVPEGLTEDELQDAASAAVLAGFFPVGKPENYETDAATIEDGWEFTFGKEGAGS